MKSFEQIKKEINEGVFENQMACYVLALNLESVENALRKKNDIETADKLKAYKEAFTVFSNLPGRDGVMDEEGEKACQEAYETIKDFQEFIEAKPAEGKKSNYEKISEVFSDPAQDLGSINGFLTTLGRVNDSFAFGINIEALPKPVNVAKDEEEDEKDEDEDEIDINDPLLAGMDIPGEDQGMNIIQGEDGIDIIDNNNPQAELYHDNVTSLIGNCTAAQYIERLKANGFPKKDPATMQPEEKELALDRFLRIMAAREMADSVRNDKDKLVKYHTNAEDIEKRAKEMKNDPTFRKYLATLRDDPAKMKAAIAAATKGHGGGLDDMFKDFVKHQPAGELENPAILKRYMPTVKERIEILQKDKERFDDLTEQYNSVHEKLVKIQNKYADKSISTSVGNDIKRLQAQRDNLEQQRQAFPLGNLASEILVLRNMVHANRDKKSSLDKPIPVTDSKQGSLVNKVEEMNRPTLMRQDEVTKLITKGHGGEMVEKARELADNENYRALDQDLKDRHLEVLKENTIEAHLPKISREANTLATQIRKAMDEGDDVKELVEQGKKLLAETFIIDSKIREKEHNNIDDGLKKKDMPWTAIENMQKNGPESNDTFKTLIGNVYPETICDHLELLSEGHEKYVNTLATEPNTQKALQKYQQKFRVKGEKEFDLENLDFEKKFPDEDMNLMGPGDKVVKENDEEKLVTNKLGEEVLAININQNKNEGDGLVKDDESNLEISINKDDPNNKKSGPVKGGFGLN